MDLAIVVEGVKRRRAGILTDPGNVHTLDERAAHTREMVRLAEMGDTATVAAASLMTIGLLIESLFVHTHGDFDTERVAQWLMTEAVVMAEAFSVARGEPDLT